MKVVIRAFGILKEGVVTLDLEEGCTVRDAIRLLNERYRKEVEDLLLTRTSELGEEVFVFHDGFPVDNAQAPLTDGDLFLTLALTLGG
jgi:hypothetical protein